MSDDKPSQVLGSLPRSRPHRRSDKRTAREQRPEEQGPEPSAPKVTRQTQRKPKSSRKTKPAATGKARSTAPRKTAPKRSRGDSPRLRQPPQPRGTPANKAPARPQHDSSRGQVVGTAVQAAAELAEMGLSVSARVLRGAISRLPRP